MVYTSVTFDVPVLGIIYKDPADPYGTPSLPFYPLFNASNFLGAPGTQYKMEGASACGPYCGFEVNRAPIAAPALLGQLTLVQKMTFARSLTAIKRLAKDRCGLVVLVCREGPGPDARERRPSRLMATAAENRLNVRRT